MRAVWQLSLVVWRQMAVLVVLAGAIWLVGVALLVASLREGAHLAGMGLNAMAFGSWFWHLGQGQMLRGLCRPESLLLPRFRARLAGAGALDLVLWIALPATMAALAGMPHVMLAARGLMLATALGLAPCAIGNLDAPRVGQALGLDWRAEPVVGWFTLGCPPQPAPAAGGATS